MKNRYKIITMLPLFAVLFCACEKDHNFAPYTEYAPTAEAKLKFTHAAVGPNGTNFTINYLVNDKKVSSIAAITGLPLGFGYGSQFPVNFIYYAFVQPGAQTLKVVKPATTAVPEATIASETITTEAGKNYSSFLVGLSPNYSVFTLNDDLSVSTINSSKAYVRFINLIANTPVAGYDLGIIKITPATSTTPLTRTEVFVPLETIPENENSPYEVELRTPGTTTVIAKLATSANFNPRPGRIYTVYARGYVGGLSGGLPSTTVNIPALSFYTNK
jgi:Domain of unknown function (DUF4397)